MLYLSELDFFLMFTVLKVSLNKGQIFSWSLKLSCNNDSVIIIARREPGEDYAIAPVCECVHNQQACILSPADLKYYQTDQPNILFEIWSQSQDRDLVNVDVTLQIAVGASPSVTWWGSAL